jgi:hypothetical protein
MKLHHTKYKQNYKNYILNCIELDNDGNVLKTDQDKINYLFNRFILNTAGTLRELESINQ